MGEPVADIGTDRLAQQFIALLNFKTDGTNSKISTVVFILMSVLVYVQNFPNYDNL